MMRQVGRYGYNEIEDGQVLELPYLDGELSMVIILPSNIEKFSKIESQLTQTNLDNWLGGIRQAQVSVSLPKFKIMWGDDNLTEPLNRLGIRVAFGPQADFSKMDGKRDLFFNSVVHKAFVEVNEQGTEAAAATVVKTLKGSARRVINTIKTDHPFFSSSGINGQG